MLIIGYELQRQLFARSERVKYVLESLPTYAPRIKDVIGIYGVVLGILVLI